MRINQFVSILLALFAFNSSLSAHSFYQQMAVSIVEKCTDCEEKPKGSYDFKQTFGVEKITLRFPAKPKSILEDGVLEVALKKDKVEYVFIAPKPPLQEVDAETLFALFLEDFNESSLEVVKQSIYAGDYGQTMDVVVKDNETKRSVKARLVVTKNNFYLIGVEYPNGGKKPVIDQFIHSFEIK